MVSNFLALRKKIRHLWRKHQRATIVALDKLDNDFGSLLRLIFVEKVARGREDLELELA